MFIAVTLVVLLACANVGNLLIARAGARKKEIAIRRAIGAGRARIVRQLMTESVLLALGAAVLGLPIAYRLPAFIIAQTGEVLALRLTPDGTVLAYTAALASAACLAFGLAPALRGTRPHPGSRLSLRNLLLAVQVALSVVLLTGAGLALQGVAHLRRQDPGFSIAGVSVVSFELPARDYDPARAGDFDRRLVDALSERLSGRAFGLTDRELFPNGNWHTDFRLPGEPESATRGILAHLANAGYFAVLRIPTLAGRAFAPGDEARDVILVNQSLARLFWKNDSPIGKRVIASGRPRQIIGVVKDAYTENLDRIEATLYLPSFGAAIPKVLVPLSAAEAVAAIAKQIEPRARTQAVPLRDSVERWLKVERIGAEIAALLGLYALILATVGMSGVFAYVVQQRTKEIGIRVALGARPAGVARLVLASSSRAVIAGLCIGVPCAMLGARLMRGVLYGVSPLDPFAYLSVACILAGAALAASYAPARRAARVDPPEALRHE